MEQQTQHSQTDVPSGQNQVAPKYDSSERLFGALSYFTIAVMATIVSKPKSEFCMFHAKQGVALIGADLALMVLMVLALIVSQFIGYLLFFFGTIGLFVLHLIGAIQAFKGNMYKLPFIHEVSKRIHFEGFIASNDTIVEKNVENTHDKIEDIAPINDAAPRPQSQNQVFKPGNTQDMVGKAVEQLNENKGQQN